MIISIKGMNMFKNFTTENWLSFWSIGVPVMASAVGFILSLISKFFSDRSKNRPVILLSINKFHRDGLYRTELILKNYGATLGTIKSIKIDPEFKSKSKDNVLKPNSIMELKDFPLAPGQTITTTIHAGSDTQLEESEKRTFTIKYRPDFCKVFAYKEKYSINEKTFPTIFSDGNFTTAKRVEQLTESMNKKMDHIANSLDMISKNSKDSQKIQQDE